MILGTDPKGAAAAQRGMAARRYYTGDLHGIDVPTLVIRRPEDTIRPVADAELMHQRFVNSRLENNRGGRAHDQHGTTGGVQ